ncbi:hypothetical protein MLD38_039404 [Melastoma candidum]|uniref:Uncharacterized protein n=1 Tax=Melastoma candidum TaxID=119954 RepID=A0ACB9L1Z9_9MYRT|nr:hypothetical protein MLD38_039404 [Melastoma candidum]
MAAAVPVPVPPQPPRGQQRGSHRMFAASDDIAMMKQIQATHAPDGRLVEVKPILNIIESIFHRATPSIVGILDGKQDMAETVDEKANIMALDSTLDTLPYVIHKISCELSCKCSGGGDAHGMTMSIFNMLSAYAWEAKAILALAAFAMYYGEFSLVAKLCATNVLAKSVAVLKQLPDILEHSSSLKPLFDAVNNLIVAVVDVTKGIVLFGDLPSQYISAELPPLSVAMTHIPTAVYWTIRSIVTCASQIAALIGMGHEHIAMTTEAWELSGLAYKISSIHDHLKKQLTTCHQHIEDKKQIEAYQLLVRIFERHHVDNMPVLKLLLNPKDDPQPLWEGMTQKRVTMESMRSRTMLLLISDLDISVEDVELLDHFYRESRTRPELRYEMVWLPVVDNINPSSTAWEITHQKKFEDLRSKMYWHSIYHPSFLEPAVIKYIKDVWHFSKRMIIVVLDPQGRLASPNALHMIRIWLNLAYPFTREREEALWKGESWKLELILDGLDDGTIYEWMKEGRYICLYGGDDMEWIKKFTSAAKEVAKAAGITFEMIYVGRSNAKEKVRKTVTIVTSEKLSYCWLNPTFFSFFWARLESMLYSKLQLGRTIENDNIMHEVMTLLGYDGSDKGWAIFCRGMETGVARAKSDNVLGSLEKFGDWKAAAAKDGFIPALQQYLAKVEAGTQHHCNRLILPGLDGGIPERIVCAECGRIMEKFIMYRCCTE